MLIANDFNNLLLKNIELDKIKLNFDIIKEAISRIARLIKNVKLISQIEENKPCLQCLDVIDALGRVKENIIKLYPNKEIEINIDIPNEKIIINANDLLIDLFENLFLNAINHNLNQKVEIFIKISKLKNALDKYIKIQIIDNGIGIDNKRKKTIFNRIYNKDKNLSDTGLGLSLVKKIIDTFQGEIWIEDRIKGDFSKGSNFIIKIPEIN